MCVLSSQVQLFVCTMCTMRQLENNYNNNNETTTTKQTNTIIIRKVLLISFGDGKRLPSSLLVNEWRETCARVPELTKGATNISRIHDDTAQFNRRTNYFVSAQVASPLFSIVFRLCVVSANLGAIFQRVVVASLLFCPFVVFFFTISIRQVQNGVREYQTKGPTLSFTHKSDKDSNTSGHTNISQLYKVFSTTFSNKNK